MATSFLRATCFQSAFSLLTSEWELHGEARPPAAAGISFSPNRAALPTTPPVLFLGSLKQP